jgi:two-component system cell cycle sensor histidine kinase/response regulator CckA
MAHVVLVVDDNPSNLKLACEVLGSGGYQVRGATCAESALASMADELPELVLLDLALPGMDGMELARTLKMDPRTRSIPVVAMTASAMKGDEEKARRAGFDGYITKPIDTRKLPRQVADYLAGKVTESPKNLLIVEDVDSNRKLLQVTLEAEGFVVFQASDGLEALAILERESIDGIITDILMPNMDGYRLCYEVRSSERWYKVPLIVYTNTYTAPGDEQVALELGADRYLKKPSPPRVLVDALMEAARNMSGRERRRIQRPEGLELLKSYSGRLVAKLEERNAELVRRAQALSDANQLLSQLTAHIPEVFWLSSVDRDRVFYVSPTYETLFGRTCESLVERPRSWLDAVHPEDRSRIEALWRNVRDEGEYDERYRIMSTRGEVRWIRERSFPIRNEAGEIQRLAGLAEDISESKALEQRQRQLEARLMQAQKLEALGTLASAIAHDFNNILGAMMGHAELVQAHLSDTHPARASVSEIVRASQRAADVVRQILTFGRKQDIEREALDLRPVILEAITLLRANLPPTVEIRSQLADRVYPVVANSSQIHQVIMNLCSNATHAMASRGGTIEIRQDLSDVRGGGGRGEPQLPKGSYVRVRVADQGHGMDATTLEQIFEPFFTTKDSDNGTGLGLFMVRNIMRDHGGEVVVESQPGQGTQFELWLPLLEVPSTQDPLVEDLVRGRGEHLLLVDDQSSIAGLTARTLEMLGYQVTAVSSSRAALAMFSSRPAKFDLVLAEADLSDLTGLALIEQLHEIRGDIPSLLLCSRDPAVLGASQERLQPAGDLLLKPFRMPTLARSVRRALDRNRS